MATLPYVEISSDDFERLYISRAEYNSLRAELAALREENRWIPVSERLPEESDKSYLCHTKNVGFATIRFFRPNRTWNDNSVTHWRPLPEPPAGPEVEV